MHEFEARIADWRAKLQNSIHDYDAVDELEEHLRELLQTESRTKSTDDAWRAAVGRLGGNADLAQEFKKVHGMAWLDSLVYWATSVLLLLVLAGLVMPMIAGLRDGRSHRLLITHVALVAIGYTLTIAAGVVGMHYATRGVLANRSNKIVARRLPATVALLAAAAMPLTLIGIILGAVWSAEHRGAFWIWDLREVSAMLVVLAQTAIVLASWSHLPIRWPMALALIACGLTLCAWSSPTLFQGNGYGFVPVLALVVVHAVAALFMMTGILLVAARPRLQRA